MLELDPCWAAHPGLGWPIIVGPEAIGLMVFSGVARLVVV
jgi:hypothetical protein